MVHKLCALVDVMKERGPRLLPPMIQRIFNKLTEIGTARCTAFQGLQEVLRGYQGREKPHTGLYGANTRQDLGCHPHQKRRIAEIRGYVAARCFLNAYE